MNAKAISAAERLHALDAMRGVAILGVLLAYTVWNLGNLPFEQWSRADQVITGLMDVLVDNKFLTMFAFLFGLGVAQQWRRWEVAGDDPVPLHRRRMGFLLAIGLIHAALLRNGDILAPYALLGLVLLAFRRVSSRAMAIAAILLALAPHAVQALVATGRVEPWASRPSGGGGTYLGENLAWLRYWYLTNPLFSWPRILALMLAGVLVGRAGLIERLASDRRLALRAVAAVLPLAVFLRLGYELLGAFPVSPELRLARGLSLGVLYQLSSWALSAGYAAILLLALQRPRLATVSWPVRAIGRMAFTSYLVQAVLVVPICLIFGLFDRMTPTGAVLLALAVAVLQVGFSTWWLRSHGSGPLERVWRRVTYGPGREMAAPRPVTAVVP